jgi:capsular exopolysaccharide synthesis family protein
MSRVDEALKRAGRDDGREDHALAVERSVGSSDLDRYPVERPVFRPIAREQRPAIAAQEVESRPRSLQFARDLRGKLVTTPEIEPTIVEQYRRLATVLGEVQASRAIRTLTVTSALPREGKTLTVTNLALTLSDSYQRRVLIVDADLRHPCLHQQFGLANDVGLSDFLRSPDAICRPVEVRSNLSVVPAGRAESNPVTVLSSARMQSLLVDAASRFDWVLLDTPPVGLLSDAQLVARFSDAVLLVIAAGLTPYPLAQRAIVELGPDRLIGTVLNRIQPEALPVRDYYGRYYYRDRDDRSGAGG